MSATVPAGPVFDFHARLAPRPGAAQQLLATLDRHGIERAAVSAGGTIDVQRLSRQLVEGGHVDVDPDNDAVLAASGAAGGRLVPFYFANSRRPVQWYQKQAAEFRGLELSPAVHGLPLTDPKLAAFVDSAEEFGHPVYVVCLDRTGCRVADLVRLATDFPRVQFVLGHGGVGNLDVYGVELVRPLPNIAWESSGGYSCVARAAVDRLGPDRLVFGTEYPLQHPSVELAKFAALDLRVEQWRRIAWWNAHRLIGECVGEDQP